MCRRKRLISHSSRLSDTVRQNEVLYKGKQTCSKSRALNILLSQGWTKTRTPFCWVNSSTADGVNGHRRSHSLAGSSRRIPIVNVWELLAKPRANRRLTVVLLKGRGRGMVNDYLECKGSPRWVGRLNQQKDPCRLQCSGRITHPPRPVYDPSRLHIRNGDMNSKKEFVIGSWALQCPFTCSDIITWWILMSVSWHWSIVLAGVPLSWTSSPPRFPR